MTLDMAAPLKSGWRRVKFGDVVRLSKARSQNPLADGLERYVGLEHLEPGDLRIRSWGNVADGTTFTNRFEPGQVLFGKRRAYQRKVAVADFAGVCSGDIYVLESKDADVLLPELLPFICQTDAFFEHAVGTSAGSLSPRTNWTSLADFVLLLPPMLRQKELIKLCRAAYECVQSIEQACQAFGSVIQAQKDVLGDGASLLKAKEYLLSALLVRSPESGCSAPPKDASTGHFVLGLASLSRRGYVSGDFKAVESSSKMLAARLTPGDLLISRSNTADRVGYVGIFTDERNDISFPDTMMRLKSNPSLIDPRYLEALLQATPAREYLMRIAAGTSASMKKINRANLLNMPLRVPPLEDQRVFLSTLDTFRKAMSGQLERLETARSFARKAAAMALDGG